MTKASQMPSFKADTLETISSTVHFLEVSVLKGDEVKDFSMTGTNITYILLYILQSC